MVQASFGAYRRRRVEVDDLTISATTTGQRQVRSCCGWAVTRKQCIAHDVGGEARSKRRHGQGVSGHLYIRNRWSGGSRGGARGVSGMPVGHAIVSCSGVAWGWQCRAGWKD